MLRRVRICEEVWKRLGWRVRGGRKLEEWGLGNNLSTKCALYEGWRGIMAIWGGYGAISLVDIRFYRTAPPSSMSFNSSLVTPSVSCIIRARHTLRVSLQKNPPQRALSALLFH